MANLDKKLFDALVDGVTLASTGTVVSYYETKTVGDLIKVARETEKQAVCALDAVLKSPLVPAVESFLSQQVGSAVKLKREGLFLVYEGEEVSVPEPIAEKSETEEPKKVSKKASKKKSTQTEEGDKSSKVSKSSKKKSSKTVDAKALFLQHLSEETLPVKADLQAMADWLGVNIDSFGKGRKEPWVFLQETYAQRAKEEAGVEIDEVTEIPVEEEETEEVEAAPVEAEEPTEVERKTIILEPKKKRGFAPAPAKTIKQEMLDDFSSIDDLLDHGSTKEEEPAPTKKKTKYDLIMEGIKDVDLDAILAADPKDALKLAGFEDGE